MGYPLGRIVMENMRTDPANLILGQRVNTWTSILVFLLGVWLWHWFGKQGRRPSRAGGRANRRPVDEVQTGHGRPSPRKRPRGDEADP